MLHEKLNILEKRLNNLKQEFKYESNISDALFGILNNLFIVPYYLANLNSYKYNFLIRKY